MNKMVKNTLATILAVSLVTIGLMLAGCGGSGGGLSSNVVSGTAAVGAPLAGQVSLKDSSSPAQQKTTVIGSDGTFAIDVTEMKAPYVLRATGSAGSTDYKLHSYAAGTGIANINPLSNVIVASAAGVDDPSDVYENANSERNQKIGENLSQTISILLAKLEPLLKMYNAQNINPITSRYIANHLNMDEMFDNIKIAVSEGALSIINAKTGANIFTGKVNNIANGVFSNDGINMPSAPAVPVAPTGVVAVGAAAQVTLTWTAVSNATSYNVYFASTPGVSKTNGTKIAAATSPYIQSGLAAGTTYYYVVTAVNSAGESTASNQVSTSTTAVTPVPTLPAAPTGVMATGGTNQVTLSWSAVSNATSYNVYYSTTAGVTKANGTVITNATSPAVQTSLAAGTTYYYIVTALNSAGESAASVQVAATTLASVPVPTIPAAPTGVSASGGANQVTVSWAAVSGAASYNVYWSATSGVTKTNGTKDAGVTSPYVKTTLSAGTAYYFIVTAVNSAGESVASAQTTATTNAAPPSIPAAPTGVTATGGANQVSVNWSAVTGATSYNVYWSTVSGVTKTNGTKITNAARPYVQTGLGAATAYYYIVTAANSSGESVASAQATATTNPAPAPTCGSCHAIPPSTGQHSFHVSSIRLSCASCHGTGYSATTVNAATHNNGVKNVVSGIGWNAASQTCATPGCHGSRGW